jgi:hypothetical protein
LIPPYPNNSLIPSIIQSPIRIPNSLPTLPAGRRQAGAFGTANFFADDTVSGHLTLIPISRYRTSFARAQQKNGLCPYFAAEG